MNVLDALAAQQPVLHCMLRRSHFGGSIEAPELLVRVAVRVDQAIMAFAQVPVFMGPIARSLTEVSFANQLTYQWGKALISRASISMEPLFTPAKRNLES